MSDINGVCTLPVSFDRVPNLPSFLLPLPYLVRHGQNTIHLSLLIELLLQTFSGGEEGEDGC